MSKYLETWHNALNQVQNWKPGTNHHQQMLKEQETPTTKSGERQPSHIDKVKALKDRIDKQKDKVDKFKEITKQVFKKTVFTKFIECSQIRESTTNQILFWNFQKFVRKISKTCRVFQKN